MPTWSECIVRSRKGPLLTVEQCHGIAYHHNPARVTRKICESINAAWQVGIEHKTLSNPSAGEIAKLMLTSLSILHGRSVAHQPGSTLAIFSLHLASNGLNWITSIRFNDMLQKCHGNRQQPCGKVTNAEDESIIMIRQTFQCSSGLSSLKLAVD